MSHSDKALLQHILDETDFIELETNSISRDFFLSDRKTQKAFSRSIEIIGEAVKNLSKSLVEQYPNVEWRSIAGMRDKLIHGYFSVNYTLVWDVAVNEIPKLRQTVEGILKGKPDIL